MEHYCQTRGEEIANSLLHCVGCMLGILGLIFLINHSQSFSPAYVIFSSTMIFMFFASTMYHAIIPLKIKEFFRVIDHQAIYIFIAGTYTPFCLVALKGSLGLFLLCFEWICALLGVILSAFGFRFLKKIEIAIFIMMGWAILVGGFSLTRLMSLQSILFLLGGGAAYTAGIFWYKAGKVKFCKDNTKKAEKKQKRLFFGHVIWHLFVLAGAVCHWFSVWHLSLP